MLLRFEEISNNAWPALQTIQYDGWLIRLGNGVTKRSNSVTMLYPSTLDPSVKVDYCEKVYLSQGITPCFKVTEISTPGGIDGKKLAVIGEGGRGHEPRRGLPGGLARLHQVQKPRAERGVGDVLRGSHPHPGPCMGATRRHCRGGRGYHHAEGTGPGAAGKEGEGHSGRLLWRAPGAVCPRTPEGISARKKPGRARGP